MTRKKVRMYYRFHIIRMAKESSMQNRKVVSNVIIIQKANTISNVAQHGSPTKAKVRSGIMEE
jgi:hypothetical protein